MSPTASWSIQALPALDASVAGRVHRVADEAAEQDAVRALSEHSVFHLESPGSTHLLGYARSDDDYLLGYAQVWEDGASELVVAPSARRRGLGSALWTAARMAGAQRVWAHGSLPGAAALAAAHHLTARRELHQMARPLTDADAEAVDLPGWVGLATYADRGDPAEWVALNAAAFADHPEQGRLNVEDFEARAAEPWFDPEGLLYLLDTERALAGPPIAFHWTKVDGDGSGWAPGTEAGEAPGTEAGEVRRGSGWAPHSSQDGVRRGVGEVYAVGIDPAYRGRGLAGPLTRVGTAHLARRGLARVVLYVDGDNIRALRTYRRAGFEDIAVDVVYAPDDNAVKMDR